MYTDQVKEIISRKKQGQDCTEEESGLIKQWVKTTIIQVGTGEVQINADIQSQFPNEYGEALEEMENENIEILDFIIPEWAVDGLMYCEYEGLTDAQMAAIDKHVKQYGNTCSLNGNAFFNCGHALTDTNEPGICYDMQFVQVKQEPTATDKIKLVVVNENILGYIFPEYPNIAHILQGLISKGYNGGQHGTSVYIDKKKVRLASAKDFDEFRVSFDGYRTDPAYEFDPA